MDEVLESNDLNKPLLIFAQKLSSFAEESCVLELPANENFKLMLSYFLGRTISSLKSITALAEAGQYNDCILIVGSMIEGSAWLKWVIKNPEENATAWKTYEVVCDYKTLKGNSEIENRLDATQKQKIEKSLLEDGLIHLKKDRTGELLDPSSYHNEWYKSQGLNITDVIKHLDEEVNKNNPELTLGALGKIKSTSLKTLYSFHCEWKHFNPVSLRDTVTKVDQENITYEEQVRYANASLSLGIQMLFPALGLANKVFQLEIEEKINLFFEEFKKFSPSV